jgi:hypothetical protein
MFNVIRQDQVSAFATVVFSPNFVAWKAPGQHFKKERLALRQRVAVPHRVALSAWQKPPPDTLGRRTSPIGLATLTRDEKNVSWCTPVKN